VADDPLGDEGRRPAADQFEEVEGALGCSPLVALRFEFVCPVREGRDDGNDDEVAQDPTGAERIGEDNEGPPREDEEDGKTNEAEEPASGPSGESRASSNERVSAGRNFPPLSSVGAPRWLPYDLSRPDTKKG